MVVIHSAHHVFMHFIVQCYQFITVTVNKVKQIVALSVNVNQVWTIIMAIINQRRRQVQRRNQSRQARLSDIYQYLCTFVLLSALFAICVFIMISFHVIRSGHHLNHLAWQAVSNSAESSRSQVLHLLSTSVATFVFRMAAAQPTSAAVNEAAASVAKWPKSTQSLTVANAKNEELNNDAQSQAVRHALSQIESTQKDQELQRVMEHVVVNSEPTRSEHLLRCLIKSHMADHPQQWDDHSADVRYFIGSLKYFQGRLRDIVQCQSRIWSVLHCAQRVRVSVMADLWMDQVTESLRWDVRSSESGLSCASHVQQDWWCNQSLVLPQGCS